MSNEAKSSKNIRGYVVTHRPLPPYTQKRWEEVVPLCFDHGSKYVEMVVGLGGVIRLGLDLPEGICVVCVEDGGGK